MLSRSLQSILIPRYHLMKSVHLSTTHLQTTEVLYIPFDQITNENIPSFVPQTPSGWQPIRPGGPLVKNLPFHVFRSKTNNLAIYSRFRKVGPKVNTVIRRVEGDLSALITVLQNLLGKDRVTQVDIREAKINLRGNRVIEVTRVLYRLGF